MALNSLFCADVPLSNYSLTHCRAPLSNYSLLTVRLPSHNTGIQGAPRLCTVVPWPVHLRCRPSKSLRALLFLQRLPRSASGSPLHCWQPSIFGCWPSGVEMPATRGHVGAVSGDLPHSTRDFSVHWVISWHSADLTYMCLHTVCSGPSSVFNT